MELANKRVYGRGKGLIVALVHSEHLFCYQHNEEGEVDGLENSCCMRGKYNSFDMVFAKKPEHLGSDMCLEVIHQQHSSSFGVAWNSPQCRDVWDQMMANETFKNRAIDIWLGIELAQEILAWAVSALINIIRNCA
jgi:hypothetical protein